jgi:hypothetical protein
MTAGQSAKKPAIIPTNSKSMNTKVTVGVGVPVRPFGGLRQARPLDDVLVTFSVVEVDDPLTGCIRWTRNAIPVDGVGRGKKFRRVQRKGNVGAVAIEKFLIDVIVCRQPPPKNY